MWLTAKSLRMILIGVIGLALVLLGVSTYKANDMLKGKSKDVRAAQLRAEVLQQEETVLRKAKADIEKYKDLAAIAKSIVPQDKDQAQTAREITNLAAASNIKLGAITFPNSLLGGKLSKGTKDSQLKPAAGIPGTYTLTITLQSADKIPARFSDFVTFLQALEQNRRTALVTGINLTPDANSSDRLQFTLTIDEYIKP
jgi:hypothetical protein